MTAADLGQRLPVPGTGDELDELGRAFNDLLDRLHEAFVRLNEAYDAAAPVRRRRLAPASHAPGGPARAGPGRASPRPLRRRNTGGSSSGSRAKAPACGRSSSRCSSWPSRKACGPSSRWWTSRAGCPTISVAGRPTRGPSDLRAEVADDGPMSRCESIPPLLAQLLDNLLENACKYSAPGTPVVVRAWREDGSVVLGVEDRGLRAGTPRICPASSSRSSAGEQARVRTGTRGSALAWPSPSGSPTRLAVRSTSGVSPRRGAAFKCVCPKCEALCTPLRRRAGRHARDEGLLHAASCNAHRREAVQPPVHEPGGRHPAAG